MEITLTAFQPKNSSRDVTNVTDLADRAHGYGIPGVVVDGMDVVAVYEVAKEAVARARRGEGPTLLECKTYRWQGHHVGDPANYRSRKNPNEKAEWMKRDPVVILKEKIIKDEIASEAEIIKIENEIEKEIQEAVKFAAESPYPDVSEAFTDIFA